MFSSIAMIGATALALLFVNVTPSSAQVFVNLKDIDGQSFDYIVVGAGTSGCVIASRLAAASPNISILLSERGPATFSDVLERNRKTPSFTTNMWFNHEISDPIISTSIDPTTPKYHLVRGKGMGGTTNINAGAWSRPLYTDFNAWNTTGWTASDIKSQFTKIENGTFLNVDSENFGTSGPLTVSYPKKNQTFNDDLITAIQETGKPIIENGCNGIENYGVWPVLTANNGGKRLTSCEAYFKMLHNVRGGTARNLIIVSESQVSKILFNSAGTEATSVLIQSVGSPSAPAVTAHVSREVIVSSGVYGSAQLLMLSGIGPASDLEKLDIPVVKDLPVGKNFVSRPMAMVIRYGKKQHPEQDPTKMYDPQALTEFQNNGSGILSIPIVGLWGNLRFGQDTPVNVSDTLIGFTAGSNAGKPFGLGFNHIYDWILRKLKLRPGDIKTPLVYLIGIPSGMTGMCLVSDPKSRGTVSLKSADWNVHPEVKPDMFSVKEDLDKLISCTNWLREVFTKDVMKKRFPSFEIYPSLFFPSDSNTAHVIKNDEGTFSHHAWGTTPIGNKDSPIANKTVVGEDLKILGISNVRVADSSIIPAGFSSGVMSVAYAIGERASEIILADSVLFAETIQKNSEQPSFVSNFGAIPDIFSFLPKL